MSESERIQNKVKELMQSEFSSYRVKKEWHIDINRHRSSIYEPRVDIAVGPFAVEQDSEIEDTRGKIDRKEEKFRRLVEMTNRNFEDFESRFEQWSTEKILDYNRLNDINRNPRCFLSIEVEANSSGKYMLGNIVNTISLGKIGIVVPTSDESERAVFRCLEYLRYLGNVGKPNFPTRCAVIREHQIESIF